MKLLDLITENDNQTLCAGRVSALLSVMVYLCSVIYSLSLGNPWDPAATGQGILTVLTGAGVFIASKDFVKSKSQTD